MTNNTPTALPDGWRTAEHPLHGPGIITTPTPLDSGRIHFITPATNLLGYRWHLLHPAELTYPDTPDDPQRRRNLPPHRTEAGHPNCATCDGGGCPDCTDPA